MIFYIRPLLPLLFILCSHVSGKWVWHPNRPNYPHQPHHAAAAFSDIFGLQQEKRQTAKSSPIHRLIAHHHREDTLTAPQLHHHPEHNENDVVITSKIYDEDDNVMSQVLDIKKPNSPYGLIQNVFPDEKEPPEYNLVNRNGLQMLDDDDVWMSVGNLLVLRGGTSSDKAADWPPLDDYQAPHRAPKLAASLEDAAKIAAKFPSLAVVVPPPFQEDQLQAPINQELKVNNRKPRRFTNNINKVLYQHNDDSSSSPSTTFNASPPVLNVKDFASLLRNGNGWVPSKPTIQPIQRQSPPPKYHHQLPRLQRHISRPKTTYRTYIPYQKNPYRRISSHNWGRIRRNFRFPTAASFVI